MLIPALSPERQPSSAPGIVRLVAEIIIATMKRRRSWRPFGSAFEMKVPDFIETSVNKSASDAGSSTVVLDIKDDSLASPFQNSGRADHLESGEPKPDQETSWFNMSLYKLLAGCGVSTGMACAGGHATALSVSDESEQLHSYTIQLGRAVYPAVPQAHLLTVDTVERCPPTQSECPVASNYMVEDGRG